MCALAGVGARACVRGFERRTCLCVREHACVCAYKSISECARVRVYMCMCVYPIARVCVCADAGECARVRVSVYVGA